MRTTTDKKHHDSNFKEVNRDIISSMERPLPDLKPRRQSATQRNNDRPVRTSEAEPQISNIYLS